MTALPLRYLIDIDDQLDGHPREITEVGYDGPKPHLGEAVRYGNLYDQTGTGKYGPYLRGTDTAKEYEERVVDPHGAGWSKLLSDQCESAKAAGFDTIEWDNPDGYDQDAVLGAVQFAADHGLSVLAKNPLICDWAPVPYVRHPAVVGVIVEKDDDATAAAYDDLRKRAGKPDLPIWFVSFKAHGEDGKAWATKTAAEAANYHNMFVTYSPDGEYTSSQDVGSDTKSETSTMAPTYSQRWPTYAQWWDEAKILPQQAEEVTSTVVRLRKNESRYQNIENLTGVPWELIAALHERESGARFDRQLAQGDPLNRRSTNEPISGPFDTFEASAVWALHHDSLDKVIDWRIEKMLYYAELWNGWGYAMYHPATPSPYVVGGTTVQKPGKYIADRLWSSTTWDVQIGVMAMLLELARQDAAIKYTRETAAGTPGDPHPPVAPPAPVNKIPDSSSISWIQSSLNTLGANLIVDGISGPVTKAAIRAFQASHGLVADGIVGPITGAAILEALKPSTPPGPVLPPIIEPPKPPADPAELHDLGHRIRRTMLQLYPQAWFPDQNVVSVEGMDPSGAVNANRPNAFDDIKMVLDGDGKIIGGPWEGTTQPGVYWTTHPMASGGAFIIALGPQACWTPGLYHDHTVWRQAEDSEIYGTRDPHCTYKRQGPPIKHGNIGVHHHGGYDLPRNNISNAAAGCQVIRLTGIPGQKEFMIITMRCPRYLADKKNYRLTATVLEAKDVLP